MSTSETPPKRPWFQIHLITAVVLMIVAGGLLGINVLWLYEYDAIRFHDNPRFAGEVVILARGWPAIWQFKPSLSRHYDFDSIFFNTFVATMILTSTYGIIEYLIRRRESRKP